MKGLSRLFVELLRDMGENAKLDDEARERMNKLVETIEKREKIVDKLEGTKNVDDAILLFTDGIGTIGKEGDTIAIGILKGTVIDMGISSEEMPGNPHSGDKCNCPSCLERRVEEKVKRGRWQH